MMTHPESLSHFDVGECFFCAYLETAHSRQKSPRFIRRKKKRTSSGGSNPVKLHVAMVNSGEVGRATGVWL